MKHQKQLKGSSFVQNVGTWQSICGVWGLGASMGGPQMGPAFVVCGDSARQWVDLKWAQRIWCLNCRLICLQCYFWIVFSNKSCISAGQTHDNFGIRPAPSFQFGCRMTYFFLAVIVVMHLCFEMKCIKKITVKYSIFYVYFLYRVLQLQLQSILENFNC